MNTKSEDRAARQADANGVRVTTSESAELRPRWLCFAIPSVGDLVFVLLLLALTCGPLANRLLGDAGIGWHIRTGELILKTHAIPRVDRFSSTMHGQPWYAWEWLYDWIAAGLHSAAGLNGVVLFTGFIIALTFTLTFRRMMERGAHLPVAVGVLLVALSASTIHFLARPHVLSWLLLVVWFGVLEKFEADSNWRELLWLPVLMLLWVNVHGGFLLGFALWGIYFVSAVLSGWAMRQPAHREASFSRARILAAAGLASALMTLLNPFGYKLHAHIYRYLGDRFLMNHIDEFLSPNFHGVAEKCFATLVLLAVVALAGARKKISLSQLLVVLFAIYSGVFAARNIPTSSILLVMIVTPQISVMLREIAGSRETGEPLRRVLARLERFHARMTRLDSGLTGHLWPALAMVVLIWTCGHQGRLGNLPVMDARFDDKRFPVRAADMLASQGNGDTVFCPDKWGGYLIYRLYPQTLVAVDDRHDLYGPEFFKRYLKIVHGEPGWDAELAAMKPDWALVPADSTVVSLLSGQAEWNVEYRDDVAILFRRR